MGFLILVRWHLYIEPIQTILWWVINIIVADATTPCHDDVIKWKHFPRYWPFVRGIHRSPVNSPHKGQWRGALMFSLICVWINDWVNNREASDLRRYHAHYDVIVMYHQVISNHIIDEWVLVFHKELFKLPMPYLGWGMITYNWLLFFRFQK